MGKFFGFIEQAPLNMSSVLVSTEIFKAVRSWFREVAILNMSSIVVTEDVLKLDKSPLNEEAPRTCCPSS